MSAAQELSKRGEEALSSAMLETIPAKG